MLQQLRRILEMIRFSHTVFALPFALLAAVMAWSVPAASGRAAGFHPLQLLGILICMVTARSAAMAFNRIADRRWDAGNPRTSGRHLPAGLLTLRSVAWFTVTMSILFVAGTLLFWPNWLPLALSVPVLLFLFGYSFAKRFTLLVHFWLGAALMMAPLAAWIAIRGNLVLTDPADILPAWCVAVAVLLWVAGFDMIYACQDVEFDRHARLHSIPARIGVPAALRLAAFCHALMIGALVMLPWAEQWGGPPLGLGWLYGAAIAAVALLLAYEHWLVRPDDLTRVNIAFFQVNAVISIGLFLVISLDLLL